MEILPFNFKTLSYCGLWSENTKFPFLKSVYKISVLTLIFYITIAQVIEFVRTYDSVEDSTQIMSICFTYITVCLKILNFILRQKEMLSLLSKFRSNMCQPNSPEESIISENYSREIKKIYLRFMLLTLSCVVGYWISPLLEGNFSLPYKSYQPYEITNNALYFATYACQVLAGIYGILINISLDTMVYGFFVLICAQCEIFSHRLMKIDDQCERFPMKKFVDHHVFIQDLILSTQSFFMQVVTPFFGFSLITLGTSIFKIVQFNLVSVQFITMVLYLACVLLQIFLYCWYGNELTVKSNNVVDAIYSSNWIKLAPTEKKGLKFVMQMGAKGRVISHHGQCSLNLNTFVWILKTSYSAFNVLQQGKE